MASFKAKFPVLQELFAKNHRGALCPPPPAGRGLNILNCFMKVRAKKEKRKVVKSSSHSYCQTGQTELRFMICVLELSNFQNYWLQLELRSIIDAIKPGPYKFQWYKEHHFANIIPRPTGGGAISSPPPLVFLRYLLNQCSYHHQTCSTLSPNNFTHCVKILKSRVL